MTPTDPLEVEMNRDFESFHRYLTAEKRAMGATRESVIYLTLRLH
jgi:hypothetical protein